MANPNKFTSKEVLNKVLLDSSGNAVTANSVTTQEALNSVLDTTNNRLNMSLAGGTISGDVTIDGDLTVNGNGSGNYDEIVNGNFEVSGEIRLNDRDGDGTFGGRIRYDNSENSLRIEANEVSGDDIIIKSNDAILFEDASSYLMILDGNKMQIGNESDGNIDCPLHILVSGGGSGSLLNGIKMEDPAISGTEHLGILFSGRTDNPGGKAYMGAVRADNFGVMDLVFYTDSAADDGSVTTSDNVMTFTHDGRLGIGTAGANVDELLHVQNDSNNAVIKIEAGSSSTGARLQLTSATNDTGDINFGDSGDTNIGRIKYDHTDNYLAIHTNDTEKMRITSGGVLLLGHTSSTNTGNLTAQAQIETTGSGSALAITRNTNGAFGSYLVLAKTRSGTVGGNTILQDGDEIGTVRFSGADGNDRASHAAEISGQVDGTPGSNDMPGRLVFKTTADGANSATERMRITSDGKVGIGETAPVAELHIKQGSAGDVDTHANVALILEGSGDTLLQFQTPNDATDVGIIFGDPDDRDVGAIKYDHSSGNDSLKFTSNGSLAMTIDSSQRVGINDSSPAKILSVKASGNDDGICLKNSSGAFLALLHQQDGDAGMLRLYDESSTVKIALNADSGENSYFNTGGNVGIGVTAPDKLLTLGQDATDGAQTAYLKILDTDTDTTADTLLEILFSKYHTGTSAADVASIGGGIEQWSGTSSNRNTYMDFRTVTSGSRTEKMRLTSNGSLAIGSSSASRKLHITDTSANAGIRITTGTALDAIIDFGDTGDGDIGQIRYDNNTDKMHFKTNTTDALTLGSDQSALFSGQIHCGRVQAFHAGNGNDPVLHVKDTADTFVAKFEGNRIADTGAMVRIFHNPSSPATSNRTFLQFTMLDAGSAETIYAQLSTFIGDNTDTQEDGNLRFSVMNNGTLTEHLRIDFDGDMTATNTTIASNSDERLKENIQDYSGGLDIITKLRPVTFEYKDSKRKQGTIRGFVAQEVKEVDDYWIGSYTIEDKIDGVKNPEYEYVKDTDGQSLTSKISAKDTMYVSAIQELLTKIDALELRIKELESK